MDVRLVLMRKRKRIWTAELHHAEATLGRARGCTVRIPSSQVSRLHCRLHMDSGVVTVEDLESVNGTFINGKRISEPEIVHPGDRLGVGPVAFVVEYELTAEEEPLGQPSEELDFEAVETEAFVELVDVETPPTRARGLETEAEVEVVEDPLSALEAMAAEPEAVVEVVEEADLDTIPLMEQEDLELSDSGNLRDFLVEMDNDEKSSGRRSK